MIFTELPVAGAYRLDVERHEDARGFFVRTFDAEVLAAHGLVATVVQESTSYNRRRGTLRGMHYQVAPHLETKLVTCLRGAIYDVVIDLRSESPSFRAWHAIELTEDNLATLYIPAGCAHGFLTLTDDAVVGYRMSSPHVPAAARGVRWDDPAFAISWPEPPIVMADRDRMYPDFVA